MTIDPKVLEQWKALAEGQDHLDRFINPDDFVFMGSTRNPDRADTDDLPQAIQSDVQLDGMTARLLLQARHIVPALIAEVERLTKELEEQRKAVSSGP